MAVYQKAAVRPGALTMPQRYYASAEIFALETERVFAKRWLCVGRAEQILNAGDYFLADVVGESLIVVRGSDGTVRAHFNVCRHRGTRMCDETKGTFSGSIMCPYHAWTYALDGALLAARNMQTVDGFDKSQYPLRQAHLAQWEGFLFVNLADEPTPFEQAYASILN